MDHICRLMRLRIYSAQIEAFPGVSMTRIIVPYINYGWSEGQHVRVRLLGSGIPGWMFLEVHPFVIASIPNSYDGLVLVCYARGRWTRRLFDLAQELESPENYAHVAIALEGPYGNYRLHQI